MPKLTSLDVLAKSVRGQISRSPPPVHLWHPEFSGEMDIRIAVDGTWFHEGRPILRKALVQLFASILRKEDDGEFYLVSPLEKYRIKVEDAPFIAIQMEVVERNDQPEIDFITATEDRLTADKQHPIWVADQGAQPRPYIRVRDKLDALISRNLFYQMVELGEERKIEGRQVFGVESAGEFFVLGQI
ncbi:MAG: DUF1285 domain-containing protein [Pseudomonadales bacterium]|nr:DUF1285 domain-containing protein [Pseudomonadales bacterium]MCP5214853.1 DUF1285 domain-containing protein [Pseudomonadales bacterium]